MKKDLGSALGLYPTPATVIGAVVDGKVNWVLAAHIGIMGHDRLMVSLAKSHYTNKGIKENKVLTVNMIDEAMLKKADYVGCVSGNNTDKSEVFKYHMGESGAPVIEESPLVMECKVVDIYETDGFENFILAIDHTYVEEEMLNEGGRIDYEKLKPVLFEMPTYSYLKTGDVIAKCRTLGREK
ncbi:MAG: flavin reductase family protein [Clostridium sp.]|nr:flavin reductase family protein [Clostridium sp.]